MKANLQTLPPSTTAGTCRAAASVHQYARSAGWRLVSRSLLAAVGVSAGLTPLVARAQSNIIWVSFHSADNAPSTDAAAAGFTEAPDVVYTRLLRNAGAQVTRYVTTATPAAATLNAANLVIISRSVDSANYQNASADAWNAITAPIMVMSGYTLRNVRLGFTTGGTIPDIAGTIRLTANNPAHAIFAGVQLDAGNTMVNPYAHLAVYTNSTTGLPATQRGISVNTDPLSGNGTVLAVVGTAGDPAANGMVIGEWQAGDTITHAGGAGSSVLGGRRLVFLSGGREVNGVNSQTAGVFDLDPDGEQLFFNAVNYLSGASLTPPPRVANISPADGSTFANSAGGLSFTAVSSRDIPTSGIIVTVNGVNVSGSLQFGGTPTSRQVTYAGLLPNKLYSVQITVTNTAGVRSVVASFDTFAATGNAILEAENFNFDGGQFFTSPVISFDPQTPNTYFTRGGQLGVADVDFRELNGGTRPAATFGEWRHNGAGATLPQTLDNTDFARPAYTTASVPDYDLMNIVAGEWWNYTRDFATTNYEVYLRVRSTTDQTVQLDRVTGDRTQTNQATVLLGSFAVGGGVYRDVPLMGPNADAVVLRLSGTQTLRLTAPTANNNLNLNYLILVPTTNAASVIGPYVSNLSPAPGSTTASRDSFTATIVNRETALNAGTVQLRIDGVLVSGLSVTPTATGANLSYSVTPKFGTSTTHTNVLSYSDTSGNSFSRTWSFTTSPDTEGPLLVFTAGNIAGAQSKLRVYFSEPIDPVTAGRVTNYTSSGGVAFSGASVLLSNQAVELTVSGVSAGQVYTMTVNNVRDALNNPILANSTIKYNLSPFEQNADGALVIEAESYHTNSPGAVGSSWENLEFTPLFPAGFVGGSAMYTDPAGNWAAPAPTDVANAARMDYRVNFIQAGTYEFWIRGIETGGGDSFHLGTNGVQIGGITGVDPGAWQWDNDVQSGTGQATFVVDAPGPYTINVWIREDGSILDRFAILPDAASPADYGFTDNGAQPGPAQSRRTGDPIAPIVTVTSPAPGTKLASGADVVVNAIVTDPDSATHVIEFFINGAKVGQDTNAPFSFTISGLTNGYYSLSVVATDPSSLTNTSPTVPIQIGTPAPRVLVLVDDDANGAYNASDVALMDRMRAYGFEVVVGLDEFVTTQDALLKELVMIASSVDSGDIAAKFTTVPVPVFNWEEANEDDLLFTLNTTGTDRGALGGQTTASIAAPGHPMAAGLTGVVTIYDSPQEVSFGMPAPGATIIATVETNASQALIYGFETGALMVDGTTTASARRVHFFLRDNTFVNLAPQGLTLLEAALEWAVNRPLTYTPPSALRIGAIGTSGGNVTISGTGGSSGSYRILSSTDLSLPVAQWTPVVTNSFAAGGDFSATIPQGSDPNRFYLIAAP